MTRRLVFFSFFIVDVAFPFVLQWTPGPSGWAVAPLQGGWLVSPKRRAAALAVVLGSFSGPGLLGLSVFRVRFCRPIDGSDGPSAGRQLVGHLQAGRMAGWSNGRRDERGNLPNREASREETNRWQSDEK